VGLAGWLASPWSAEFLLSESPYGMTEVGKPVSWDDAASDSSLRTMTAIDSASLDTLFLKARTANGFLDKPVPLELLHEVYDIAKYGATSMNTQPTRYVMLISPQARARLLPAMSPGNLDKTRAAPVTIVVATDMRFYEHMPLVWHKDGAREMFAGNAALANATAVRNGTLGAAYFMMAARACGLDCGPMSGVDLTKVNAEFFTDGRFQTNFILNLGYGDDSKLFKRNPRLTFDQACQVL
jgi:3-hydroxypropanoate dehydrogenase